MQFEIFYNGEKMASYKVIIKRNECVSCGNCTSSCPDYYEFDDMGISHLKGSDRVENDDVLELEDIDCCLDAALSCPVQCIHVYEDDEEIT